MSALTPMPAPRLLGSAFFFCAGMVLFWSGCNPSRLHESRRGSGRPAVGPSWSADQRRPGPVIGAKAAAASSE